MKNFTKIFEDIKNINYKKLLNKIDNRFSNASMRVIAAILVSIMIFTLLPSININAAANNSQTRFASIEDFQNDRWAEIQKAVFGLDGLVKKVSDMNADDMSVIANNPYFNWTETTGLTKWGGDSTAVNGVGVSYYYTD